MQGTLRPCAKPQATAQVHRDWADALFSLYLNPAVTFFWRMEGTHVPAMTDSRLLGGDGVAPGWREGSARLTPEPGHAEGRGRGHPDSRDCRSLLSPWSQTHHDGAGGSVGAKHHCHPQRHAQHSQPCVQVPLPLLPPPSPGDLQSPGLGEVLKM